MARPSRHPHCHCRDCLPVIRAKTAAGVILYVPMAYDAWPKSAGDEAIVSPLLATAGQVETARTPAGRAKLLMGASVEMQRSTTREAMDGDWLRDDPGDEAW